MAAPSPEARQLAERVAAHRAQLAAAIPPPPTHHAAMGFAHHPGDTVVDLVTGQEVTVHAAHRTAELVPPANPHTP